MTYFRLILLLFLIAGTPWIHAQSLDETMVNEVYENAKLPAVLKQFRKDYKVKIAYDDQLVSGISINLVIEKATVTEALKQILTSANLDYLWVNDKIVIVPKTQSIGSSEESKKTNLTINGTVKDAVTGETLPNALIQIDGTTVGTASNVDGFFTLVKVPSDTATLAISYLGYMPKRIKLSPDLSLKNLSITMQTDVQVLEDITIYDSYNQSMEVTNTVSKVSFNPRSMTSLPSLGELDLFKTIQLMPGISGENESSANLIIRGSLPSQNLVLLDGFTIYHLDHFFGLFSALNPDVVKDVQVYKGGFESKYGGRVGGVVDIVGKTGNTNEPTLNLGLNLISTRATLEAPIGKKINTLISFRRAFTDVIQSGLYTKLFKIARRNDEQIARPIENERLDEIQPDFFFTDFNSKFSYRPTNKDIISLSIYAGLDNLSGNTTTRVEDNAANAFFEETLNETTEWGNNGISLKWGRQWSSTYYSNLRLSVGNFFKDYGFRYNSELNIADSVTMFNANFSQKNEINDVNLSFDNEIIINDKVRLEGGLSFVSHDISYKTFVSDSLANNDNAQGDIASLYATLKADVTPQLSASLGFRLNHHETNEESYNEPRIGLNYKISESLNLKAAVGKYHQFVNQIVYDDPYQGNQNFWVFSNVDGAPIVESNHYIAGFTYQLGGFLIDIEGYIKNLNGLTEFNLVPFFNSEELDDLGFLVNGNGRMKGIDFLVQKEVGKYKGWVAYSLGRSEQSFDQVNDGAYYPSLQDRRHELKFINMFNTGKWHFSSSWIYGSGRPYAEFEVNYLTDESNVVTDFAVVKTNRNQLRLPNYHRLDLSVSYDIVWGNSTGQMGLSVFNVYGRKNIKTRRLNVAELQASLGTTNQPELTYRDLVLIDFTPSLFINFTF
ncbi:MAG: TonB-dependent receptor [Bacteroidota bacterium]